MKKVYLTGKNGKGKYAVIDNEDYEKVSLYKWYFHPQGYAIRSVFENGEKIETQGMHRFILKIPKGFVTDHINRNGLDNRKSKLRFVKQAQNLYNRQV